jgi:hypothetical protein
VKDGVVLVYRGVRQSSLLQRKIEAVKISASNLVDPHFSQCRFNSFSYQSAVLLHGVGGPVRADVIQPTIDHLAQGADLGGANLLTLDVRDQLG